MASTVTSLRRSTVLATVTTIGAVFESTLTAPTTEILLRTTGFLWSTTADAEGEYTDEVLAATSTRRTYVLATATTVDAMEEIAHTNAPAVSSRLTTGLTAGMTVRAWTRVAPSVKSLWITSGLGSTTLILLPNRLVKECLKMKENKMWVQNRGDNDERIISVAVQVSHGTMTVWGVYARIEHLVKKRPRCWTVSCENLSTQFGGARIVMEKTRGT